VENTGRGGSIVRSSYLIEGFRVAFEYGGGWHCVCADFVSSHACRHTREAAGRRAAQAQIAERVKAARSQLTEPTTRAQHVRAAFSKGGHEAAHRRRAGERKRAYQRWSAAGDSAD
jgi:hypothetical protein